MPRINRIALALAVPVMLLALTACPGIIVDNISIAFGPDGAIVGATGTFTCISPITGDVVMYRWFFGDGSSAEGQSVNHAYNSSGDFVVECHVVTTDSVLIFSKVVTIVNLAPIAYVTNRSANTVSVIDTDTNTVIDTISVGFFPRGVEVAPNGTFAYVANENSSSISIIDTSTHTVSGTISLPRTPVYIAFTPDGSRAYVSTAGDDSVIVIDAVADSVITTIGVGSGAEPVGIAVSPDGSTVYVVNRFDVSVSVISTATNTVTNTFSLPAFNANRVGFSIDGTKAYVTDDLDDGVFVINTTTESVSSTITNAGTGGVIFSSDGTMAFAADGNTIQEITVATDVKNGAFNTGTVNRDLAFLPTDESIAYVVSDSQNRVTVVDLVNRTVITTITVGGSPDDIAIFEPK